MDSVLFRALELIYQESSKKKYKPLAESSHNALNIMGQLKDSNTLAFPQREREGLRHGTDLTKRLDTELINCFKLACESKNTKIIINTLDLLQKLIDYGHFQENLLDTTTTTTTTTNTTSTTAGEKKQIVSIVDIVCGCVSISDDDIQRQMVKLLNSIVSTAGYEVHENDLLHVLGTWFKVYLLPRNNINQINAKVSMSQLLNTIFQRMEMFSNRSHDQHPSSLNEELVYRDCYVVFSYLCQIANKESRGLTNDLRAKTLSLELLLDVMDTYWEFLRYHEKFITSAIKEYLFATIVSNSNSHSLRVFKLSFCLFIALVIHFSDFLKPEIATIFPKVYLQVLETSTSIQKKSIVLQVMSRLCSNPQNLVDIFVNYDCNITYPDLYERIVKIISHIAKGSSIMDFTVPGKEGSLRLLALQCLITVVRSLDIWSKIPDSDRGDDNEKDEEHHHHPGDSEPTTSSSFVERFTKLKHTKQQLEFGKLEFNQNPHQTIRNLITEKYLEDSPEAVARFLMNEGIDKTKIGEYISEYTPFNVSVLHSFIDGISFKKMEIDAALRHLLRQFRLPGEAQKIDRIMEKFAEKYFKENTHQIFANADAAYTLSYAIIMLATDLHSPAISRKITKAEWKKTIRGMNDSRDFPGTFIDELYDRIEAEEIRLDDNASKKSSKQASFDMLQHLRKSQGLKEKENMEANYFKDKSTEQDHAKLMFSITWDAMHSCFNTILKNTDEEQMSSLCIEGIHSSIKISAMFELQEQRETFMATLSQNTQITSPKEFRKNAEAIKVLLSLGLSDGNRIKDSWINVLTCISNLEKLQLISSNKESLSKDIEFDQGLVDRIFMGSQELNSDSIVHFVQSLCHVS
eukprot:TRINITY_DN4332_c1_g3_i3.p1 TRINITY_DN4332_c1_g3~~TRINITY_DN4332_c1_g3_i3.p1  ORF type:complete len:859 (-),score=178.61 TRINITY_DN4332_c1_g3_i3:1956-4532(-)